MPSLSGTEQPRYLKLGSWFSSLLSGGVALQQRRFVTAWVPATRGEVMMCNVALFCAFLFYEVLARNDAGHLNVVLRSGAPVPRGKPRASLLRARAT